MERSLDDEVGHHGYVVEVGDEHFAMETFHDFHWDGVYVFRIADVTEVSASDVNDFFGKVITEEELRRELPPTEALRGYRPLLKWAEDTGELVVLETESTQPDEGDIWLGRVVSVSGDTVELIYIDATGCWDDEPSQVPVADITRMEVCSKYCRLFAKYAPFDARKKSGVA